MNEDTWVKLYRSVFSHEVWSDDFLFRLFCWCILKANFEAGRVYGIELKKGQFITGRMRGSEELNVSPSKWYRGMQKLAEIGSISLSVNSERTTVTVCNYESYQGKPEKSEQQVNSERTASEQQVNTKEELKNSRTQEELLGGDDSKLDESPPKTAEEVPVPPTLDTPAFIAARNEWLAMRRRKRRSVRPEYVRKTFERLVPLGAATAIECLRYTIENEYDGVFPEKFNAKGSTHGKPRIGPGQSYDPKAGEGDPNFGKI